MKENDIEEAVKTMEHWIEYEKNNKDKINKADELIYIQETILSDYKRVLKENEELKDRIREHIVLISPYYVKENYIPVEKVKDKIEELNKKEQELQNSISAEERKDYSDANISWELMDINIRRETLQELLESEEK